MNWYCVNNKKYNLLILIAFLSVSFSSCAMMQKIKDLLMFNKNLKQELTVQQKVEQAIVSQLQQNTELVQKLKSYGKKIIIGGCVLGYMLGYAFKPLSTWNASVALSSLLAAGQVGGVYDLSNVPLIKKIMDYSNTKFVAGAVIAISLPVGLFVCENLPIASALIGAILGYYVTKV